MSSQTIFIILYILAVLFSEFIGKEFFRDKIVLRNVIRIISIAIIVAGFFLLFKPVAS